MADDQAPLINRAFDRLVKDSWQLARLLAFVESTSTKTEHFEILKSQLGPTFAFLQRLAIDALLLGCARLVDDANGALSLKRIKGVLSDVDGVIVAKCARLASGATRLKKYRDKWLAHRDHRVVERAMLLDPIELTEIRTFLAKAIEILRSLSLANGMDLPELEHLIDTFGVYRDGHVLATVSREARERDDLRLRAWKIACSQPNHQEDVELQKEADSVPRILESLRRQPGF